MTASAIAALPFSLDLKGAQIVERNVGPGEKVYSVRRNGVPLLMIYTGPMSQFPIYMGTTAEVGGRTSIVVEQAGSRIAAEHLFRREGRTPQDIHVWLLATEGADGRLAEQIGQTVDER